MLSVESRRLLGRIGVRWRTLTSLVDGILAVADDTRPVGGAKNSIRHAGQDDGQGENMNPSTRFKPGPAALLFSALLGSTAWAATPADLEAAYTAQAGAPADPARGQVLFTTRHGREWSCSSCHGALPTRAGSHAATGKAIAALAPAFNPERFTAQAKSDKWFGRNCRDVLGRDCSAAEKADVLSWLRSLKP
jgi:mono/diheme cytochrome c family protein